jgi:hypothetical protein
MSSKKEVEEAKEVKEVEEKTIRDWQHERDGLRHDGESARTKPRARTAETQSSQRSEIRRSRRYRK